MRIRGRMLRVVVVLAVVVGVIVFEVLLADLAPDPCPMRAVGDAARLPPESVLSTVGRADAVPAFARRFNMTCSQCHDPFPYLNDFGRSFKENGYLVLAPGAKVEAKSQHIKKISDNLWLNDNFPLAIAFNSTLLETHTGEDPHTAPLDSIKTFVAGNFYTLGSAFVSVEFAQDEDFSPSVHGWLGYHPMRYLNVMAGRGPIFAADPYNTINGRSLTSAGENEVRDAFLTVYGRVAQFYYAVGFNSSPDGNLADDRMGNARVAADILPQLTLGAFGVFGKRTTAQIARWAGGVDEENAAAAAQANDFLRLGADLTVDVSDLHLLGVFTLDNSNPDQGPSMTNFQGYGMLYYTVPLDDRPILVPAFRVNWGQTNDGNDDTVTLVGLLSSYMLANVRGSVELDRDVATPAGVDKTTTVLVSASALW